MVDKMQQEIYQDNVYQPILDLDIYADSQVALLNEVNEIRLDYTPFENHRSIFLEPKVAIIGAGDGVQNFISILQSTNTQDITWEITHIEPQDFMGANGNLGNFTILRAQDSPKSTPLCVSQVVFFTKFDNVARIKGVHFVNEYANPTELINALANFVGAYSYEVPLNLNPNLCDFHHRRAKADGSGYCAACVGVCQTYGIYKDERKMEINLNPLDCVACGECVSVCPTGALSRVTESLESLTLQARMYNGYIPLVLQDSCMSEVAEVLRDFKGSKVLPFVVAQPHILNEVICLSLIQESGSRVLLYGDFTPSNMQAIEGVNEITRCIFGFDTLFVAHNAQELRNTINAIKSLESHTHSLTYLYTPNADESAKEVLSARLYAWVRGGSFGSVGVRSSANVKVDSHKCTLCLSCVEACNTKALINNNASFELLFKHSLCTDCGYCADACAEKVITIESHTLHLEAKSFEYVQKAYDEPFKCVECGKIFATTKSIAKIKGILASSFSGDDIKMKSIECCADCKVKIIFGPKGNS